MLTIAEKVLAEKIPAEKILAETATMTMIKPITKPIEKTATRTKKTTVTRTRMIKNCNKIDNNKKMARECTRETKEQAMKACMPPATQAQASELIIIPV